MTEQSTQQRIDALMAQRFQQAVEAYRQTDNPTWTRMWDGCAEMAQQAAGLADEIGDAEQAASLRRTAEDNTSKADVFRDKPN